MGPPNQDIAKYLQEGMSNLTDPLYLGFDAALLGSAELAAGDAENGMKSLAFAGTKNPAATSFSLVAIDFQKHDMNAALMHMYAIMDFCTGSTIDRHGAGAVDYVTKANAGMLAHRECYSGYYSMHGTEGLLLIAGDIHAITGDAKAAAAYYNAISGAVNYPTWALKPLVGRRLDGSEAADPKKMGYLAQCTTCHTNTLP
jgi:hypothetical protein